MVGFLFALSCWKPSYRLIVQGLSLRVFLRPLLGAAYSDPFKGDTLLLAVSTGGIWRDIYYPPHRPRNSLCGFGLGVHFGRFFAQLLFYPFFSAYHSRLCVLGPTVHFF